MKFTKIFSVISILSLLIFGNTWVAADNRISTDEYRIGIASSQYAMDTLKSTLKK